MKDLIKLAKERLGNLREVGSDRIVVADSWNEPDRFEGHDSFWECFVHSWDFRSSAYDDQDGLCTLPLPGNPRDGYQFVALRGATVDKVRRRIEDRLRKGTAKEVFETAQLLGVSLK